MSSFNRGRSQINSFDVGGYSFINVVKACAFWFQFSPLEAPNMDDFLFDSNGYPTVIVNGGVFYVPVPIPTQANKPGNWVATWDGGGTVRLTSNQGALTSISGSLTNPDGVARTITAFTGSASPYTITATSAPAYTAGNVITVVNANPSTLNGSYTVTSAVAGQFTATTTSTGTWISGGTCGGTGRWVFTPNVASIDLLIGISAVNSPTNYITNLQVFHINNEALLAAGEIFEPDYITKVRAANPGVIRFHPWNAERGPSTWALRKSTSYFQWVEDEFRQSLWAGIPTLAGTAYSCTLSGFSLVDKATVQLKWGTVGATSGTYTLNVSGTGAKQLRSASGDALVAGNNTYPTTKLAGTFVYDADLDCWLSFGGNLQFDTSGLDNDVPYEICIALCEKVGAHPWFTLPYLACDPPTDWITSLVALVATNGSSWMRPFFEPPNETWNFAFPFPQTAYAENKAVIHWGAGFGNNEWYGMVLSNLGQKVNAVFGSGANVVCGLQTFAGSWSAERLTSAKYISAGPTFSGYTRQAAYLTATHVAGASYFQPAAYGTGTETTLVANWVAAGRPVYAADSNGYLRTYILTTPTGGTFTLDQVVAKLTAIKAYAQTNNVNKLCCYEGGYSPDYTGSPPGSSDADKFRAAAKQVPDLYSYVLSLYNSIIGLSGVGFTSEFPSNFLLNGATPSVNAWSVLEDIYQSPTPPIFNAIQDFDAVASLQAFTSSISYAAGKITTRPVRIPQC